MQNDKNIWYVWIPLKYGLSDVNEKQQEIINDLVDEMYFMPHKMQARLFTMPEQKLPELKLIEPQITSKSNDQDQQKEIDKKEPLLSTEDDDLSMNNVNTTSNTDQREDEQEFDGKPIFEPVERMTLDLDDENKDKKQRTPKTYKDSIEVGDIEQI